ncbi:MAG TPA: hypothetical protein VJG67_03605 [Candidatus Paceibacterota bacterium]
MNYKNIFEIALEKVVAEHGYQGVIRNRDIHEQALAHRLAYHLEKSDLFTGYHIDCEYNRHGDDPKIDEHGDNFRPDILIHVRGTDDDNLIMIETKKFNDSPQEIETAQRNLASRKDYYRYKHAFLIIFPETSLQENSVVEV